MYLFVLYAAAIWVGIHYFRRRWPALIVLAFTIPVTIIGVRFLRLALDTDNTILNIVATAYEIMILIVGTVIALSPRRGAATIPCRACRYDLTGNITGACPECGRIHDPEAHAGRAAATDPPPLPAA